MRVLILSDASSIHTIKWVRALFESSIEVSVFSLMPADPVAYESLKGVRVYSRNERVEDGSSTVSKLRYLRALPRLNELIREIKPDVLHAHYATSYGMLGALSGFHPYLLSVWGSDIFDFPKISPLHAVALRFNLSQADRILSTSRMMAVETSRYSGKPIEIIPFGVDTTQFSPQNSSTTEEGDALVVGTIKAIEPTYGIEYLIRAFKIVVDRNPSVPLRLMVVGDGGHKTEMEKLTQELKIADKTEFTGRISHSMVPDYHNAISVAVFLSVSESFGVAVVEAQSCGKPVVVSDVGGLPEVVEDGVTGFVVPPRNPEAAADAIERLVLDGDLRAQMGKAGRDRVVRLYEWRDNVRKMIEVYESVVK